MFVHSFSSCAHSISYHRDLSFNNITGDLQAVSTHAHHLHLLILTYELAMIFSLGTDVG
jgi:hypothetical protein